jgi:hypothetical protein
VNTGEQCHDPATLAQQKLPATLSRGWQFDAR